MTREIGFENINVDLMLALPEQDINELMEGVKSIINLNPEHISIYSLILEENTPLYEEINSGKYELPDENLERLMYWKTKELLEKSGYIHYEISNFAKKGYESKHNLSCWNGEEYIGVGASAHSFTNSVRYSNIESIEKYILNIEKGNDIDNFVFQEKLNDEARMKEAMILGLRKIDGIDIQNFKRKFLKNPKELFKKELEKLDKIGLIKINENNIRLTEKGLDFANIVWEEFI